MGSFPGNIAAFELRSYQHTSVGVNASKFWSGPKCAEKCFANLSHPFYQTRISQNCTVTFAGTQMVVLNCFFCSGRVYGYNWLRTLLG